MHFSHSSSPCPFSSQPLDYALSSCPAVRAFTGTMRGSMTHCAVVVHDGNRRRWSKGPLSRLPVPGKTNRREHPHITRLRNGKKTFVSVSFISTVCYPRFLSLNFHKNSCPLFTQFLFNLCHFNLFALNNLNQNSIRWLPIFSFVHVYVSIDTLVTEITHCFFALCVEIKMYVE